MNYFLFLSVFLLSSCTNLQKKQGGNFYTVMDANGNLSTIEVSAKTKPKEKSPASKIKEGSNIDDDFNPADYISEEELNKNEQSTGFYSWMEHGRRNTQEIKQREAEEKTNTSKHSIKLTSATNQGSYYFLAETTPISWAGIKGREISLEKSYKFNKKLDKDIVLIELLRPEPLPLIFKSFIRNLKIALPNVLFLSERFEILTEPATPYTNYISETWSSYGYFQGVINPPASTQYILLTSSTKSGALELDSNVVKVIDLGVVEINELAY